MMRKWISESGFRSMTSEEKRHAYLVYNPHCQKIILLSPARTNELFMQMIKV